MTVPLVRFGQTGLMVCRRLKHDPATSRIPIIFMSGLEPSEIKIGAGHLGADDHLTKPVDPYELRIRVRRALERVGHSR